MSTSVPAERPSLLSVEEARDQILSYFHVLEAESVPLLDAIDRVLAEAIRADRDVPPLDNTAMDGYAVIAADTAGASPEHPVTLTVSEDLAAGYLARERVRPGTAIRIMTGAPIPPGADAVVPFEETDEGARRPAGGEGRPPAGARRTKVEIYKAAQPGANIRKAGEDLRAGQIVLDKGAVLRWPEIGLLASVGRRQVAVIRRPRVAILATGDELVEPGETPGPGQIRNSNSYTLAAGVRKYGGIPIQLGIARDNIPDLTAKIHAAFDAQADLILTSAGVSVGDFDVVKTVLAAEGEIGFWRVNMKPGKPLAFGQMRGIPHLGLPGNPVSTAVAFDLFVRPALLYMAGHTRLDKPTVPAVLLDEIQRKDDRRHFLRVIVTETAGQRVARLTGEQGSGILSSFSRANGLAILPETLRSVPAGSVVQVILIDQPEV